MKSLRFFLTFTVCLVVYGLISFEISGTIHGQPGQIHLSLGARKMSEPASPVIVNWCSGNGSGKQVVKYGSTPETLLQSKPGKITLNGQVLLSSVLKKLKAGTRYYYRCGSDIDGWSPLYSFTTEPDSGTFRVGIIGDTQNNQNNEDFQNTREITDLVRIYSPSFTLHMGDIVDNGSVPANWMHFLSVAQELNARSPLMPVLGNHDVQNGIGKDFQKPFPDFHSLFSLPGDEINYSFTYMNVRFIGIFSGCAEAAAKIDQVKFRPGSPEYKWLDNELGKAEKDRRVRWTIVWMHYPVYSFGWSNIAKWRENILPLLEKHKVDLCLAGHRHVYERHFPMKNGIPVKNTPRPVYTSGEGTVYITNGTAGGNPTGLGGKDLADIAFTPERDMYSFAIMDVNSRAITYRVFDKENLLIDWFTVTK